MDELNQLSFNQILYGVVIVWVLCGLVGWSIALPVKVMCKIETVWGHRLNFLDCLSKGPLSGFIALMTFSCPEYVDKMNEQLKSSDGDHQD